MGANFYGFFNLLGFFLFLIMKFVMNLFYFYDGDAFICLGLVNPSSNSKPLKNFAFLLLYLNFYGDYQQ
jgi:hypothetical protein